MNRFQSFRLYTRNALGTSQSKNIMGPLPLANITNKRRDTTGRPTTGNFNDKLNHKHNPSTRSTMEYSNTKNSITKRSLWNKFNSVKNNLSTDSITSLLLQFERLNDFKSIRKLLLKASSLHLELEPNLLIRLHSEMGNQSKIDKIVSKCKFDAKVVNELCKHYLRLNKPQVCMRLLKHGFYDSETLVLLFENCSEHNDVLRSLLLENRLVVMEYLLGRDKLLDLDLNDSRLGYLNGKLRKEPLHFVLEKYLKEYMNGYLDNGGSTDQMQYLIQHAVNKAVSI